MNPHGYGDETVSFVKTLNDSADKCPNHLVRKQLKDIAAEMKATVNTLASDITFANVRRLLIEPSGFISPALMSPG